jgi:hypothetical protein
MKHKLLSAAVATMMACLSGSALAAWDYEDIWWDASKSGMGFFIGHQGNTVGVGWFHYGSDGKATYLLFSGNVVNGVVNSNLERSTGPLPGAGFDPNQVVRTSVGTATLTFNSANSATFNYNYDGRTGTMNLTRMTFSDATIPSGSWPFVGITTQTNCPNPQDAGVYLDTGMITVGAPAGGLQTLTIAFSDGVTCTLNPTVMSRSGSLIAGTANMTCMGISGTGTFTTRLVGDQFINTEFAFQIPGGCATTAKASAVKQ